MRHITILFTLFILLLLPNITQSSENSDWYPFTFPEHLDNNSPLNIGKLVLDAPAGKHGFVKVKNGHFYFEDGTRAKFWGTNLTFRANFPDKKQAEIMANRIAFFGFNAVRLHHMDFHFEPNGIFEDRAPDFNDPQMKKTEFLSTRQLDKLDYFIYQLKNKGIYIDMNLLVSRHFTKADGVIDADKLGAGAKPASMFNKRLIELQKQYARNLLTHYNPYTKMRYCDDPAIALVEITNENSILDSWKYNQLNGSFFGYKKDALPYYYNKELDDLWSDWLKKKYKTIDNLRSSWLFNNLPLNSPNYSFTDQQAWTLEEDNGAKAVLSNSIHQAKIVISHITGTDWHLQYRVLNIPLKKDKKYILRFCAYSNIPTDITVISQQAFPPWKNLGLSQTISLTASPQALMVPFIPNQDCPNSKIGFSIGNNIADITIQGLSLEESDSFAIDPVSLAKQTFSFPRPIIKMLNFMPSQTQSDIKNFYMDLQSSYISEMYGYLKSSLNIKVPITGIGGPNDKDNVHTEKNSDFTDIHTYWDHPKFPHIQWDNNDFVIQNNSMLLDPNLGMIGTILNHSPSPKTKPLTITEWNHCYPNQFAYETPTLMAVKASSNHWDGLFQFDYAADWESESNLNMVKNFFDIISNPQQLILDSIASRIYLSPETPLFSMDKDHYLINTSFLSSATGFIKDKEITLGAFTFTPNENGSVILLSNENKALNQSKNFIILTIGEIKNQGQDSDGKFKWTQGPVLFKNMSLFNIRYKSGKGFTISKAQNQPWKIIHLSTTS